MQEVPHGPELLLTDQASFPANPTAAVRHRYPLLAQETQTHCKHGSPPLAHHTHAHRERSSESLDRATLSPSLMLITEMVSLAQKTEPKGKDRFTFFFYCSVIVLI